MEIYFNNYKKRDYKMVVYLITRLNGVIKQKAVWIKQKKEKL